MRGKVSGNPAVCEDVRITPAHAGKRTALDVCRASRWDHPRPCGEKVYDMEIRGEAVGSPPPMRGKAIAVALNAVMLRITPAHAGKRVHFTE